MTLDPQNLLQTANLELLARQVVEGFITGLHKSPFHGFSVEFAEHRLYNTGESVKHIDWKLFARTEKLFVKRYEEETNLRCQLVIDGSSSMYFPVEGLSKIRFSVYAAASLIYLLKKQRDAAGLTIFSDKIDYHSEPRSSSVNQRLLLNRLEELLNASKSNASTNLAQSLHQIAESIHRRSLVIIFSDMMDSMTDQEDLFSALQHLKFNKHEVIIFNIADLDKEIKFDYQNRPYIFVDVETGEKVKIQPKAVKEKYIEALQKHRQELIYKCAQYKIDLIDAELEMNFEQILLPFLVKRSKLH